MLRRWPRRTCDRRLPSEVRSLLPLDAGERPLAWTTDPDGRMYVGTAAALYLPLAGTVDGFRRLAWEQVLRADWSSDDGVLTVVDVDEATTTIRLDDGRRLLELVGERVTKSIVCSVSLPVRGHRAVTVAARRSPTGRGDLVWTVAYSPDLDPLDPAVSLAVRRARTQALAEVANL